MPYIHDFSHGKLARLVDIIANKMKWNKAKAVSRGNMGDNRQMASQNALSKWKTVVGIHLLHFHLLFSLSLPKGIKLQTESDFSFAIPLN